MVAIVTVVAGALGVAALTLLTVLLGALVAAWGHAALSSPHHASRQPLFKLDRELQLLRDLCKKGCVSRGGGVSGRLPVVLGRTVDAQLQQLLELTIRDVLSVPLRAHAHDPQPILLHFKEHIWGAFQVLEERLSQVDADKLLACDAVVRITSHFEKIRIAQSCAIELGQRPVFALSPHVMSREAELHYLRQVSELLVALLLPACYSRPPVAHLLRELLACRVLQPAIELLTDPDYLNQKVVEYVEAQRAADALHARTHELAKTFEDYIRLINTCDNVDTLKRLRYDIVTEMMQATTVQNVKRARGAEVEAPEAGAGAGRAQLAAGRAQLAAARKLKRYIAQLAFAKGECEAALRRLGWDGVVRPLHSDVSEEVPVREVLSSVAGRRQLSRFLETLCSQGLVGFWLAVEELRHSPRSSRHQLGAEIFYTYIRSPCAELNVDKESRKRMEAFLLGDSGPEVFYEVQERVVDTVRDKYYAPFLLSEQYQALIAELSSEETIKEAVAERSPDERQLSSESASSAESAGSVRVAEHSTYARRKLDQLQERHNNKTQALAALRASLKPESRALSLLAGEVERLAGERRRLEAHLARTDTWAEHLGRWRATVHSAEALAVLQAALRASLKPESRALNLLAGEMERLTGERRRLEAHLAQTDALSEHLGRWRATVHSAEVMEEARPVQFVVVVHMAQAEGDGDGGETDEAGGRPEGITTGWVLLRTLPEFQELHRKLRPLCAELKNIELPSNSFKFLFGKNDKTSLEKAKMLIQKYLEFVLEDDRLNQSEALYAFLNPSSERLKHPDHLTKKPRFSFSTLFKSTSSEATSRGSQERETCVRDSADEEEMSLYLDGEASDRDGGRLVNGTGRGGAMGAAALGGAGAGAGSEERDGIAEPLYALLGELFDMRGVFRWLRRTVVTFVQITYGRTINRQIRDTISWLFSEPMLHYYIGLVIKSWWPGGVFSAPPPQRTPEEKERVREAARQQLSAAVPAALAALVGATAAERGASKLFHTFQNAQHNKQLFYELFELLLLEVFPELKKHKYI